AWVWPPDSMRAARRPRETSMRISSARAAAQTRRSAAAMRMPRTLPQRARIGKKNGMVDGCPRFLDPLHRLADPPPVLGPCEILQADPRGRLLLLVVADQDPLDLVVPHQLAGARVVMISLTRMGPPLLGT